MRHPGSPRSAWPILSPRTYDGLRGSFRFAHPQPSHDEGVVNIPHLLGAVMLHAPFPVAPEIVEAQAVFFRKVLAEESMLETCPLGRIDLALEDRVLDALAEVKARF